MGDDAAGALGVRPERARLAYLVVGVGLVALACAAAGPISFVALAAPQLARRLDRQPRCRPGAVGGHGRGPAAGQRRHRPAAVARQRAAGGCGDRLAGRRCTWSTCSSRRRERNDERDDSQRARAPSTSRSATTTPPIIADLSVDVLDGRVTAIVGPNACGKSTLLRGLARLLRPSGGTGDPRRRRHHGLHTKEVARRLGLLPQTSIAPRASPWPTWCPAAGSRTRECCASGRRDDEAAVADAMRRYRRHRSGRPTRRRTVRWTAATGLGGDGARPADPPDPARRTDHLPRHRPPGRTARPVRHAATGSRAAPWSRCCTTSTTRAATPTRSS